MGIAVRNEGSKVSFMRDSRRMLEEVIALRRNCA